MAEGLARREVAATVVSTYNESRITAERAVDVFREAKAAGLTTGLVSNGIRATIWCNARTPFANRHFPIAGSATEGS